MVDSCGRTIDYIRISLTDRCNLRCVYCMPEEGVEVLPHSSILTYEEILRLCRCLASLGVHKVKLTGGEPLVRKGVPYLVEQLKHINGIDNVTVTTNGILLKSQMADLVNAGIDGVNISLDTLDREKFKKLTRFDKLDCVLEGIDASLAYPGVSTKINCVPLAAENLNETVIQMSGLAKNRELHVRFIELMPIGMGKELRGYPEEALKETMERAYGSLRPSVESLGNGPCVYYSIEGFQGKIGFISAVGHKFCETCNRIRLTSDGYLKNCLQYSDGIYLKEALGQGIEDAALKKMIYESVQLKPAGHRFGTGEQDGNEEKKMSQIGG